MPTAGSARRPSLPRPPLHLVPLAHSLLATMLSATALPWRRPERKLSTPFFPGAWPNNSTHSALESTVEGKEPEDIEAQLHHKGRSAAPSTRTGASTISLVSSQAEAAEIRHVDRVLAFHERIAQTFVQKRPPQKEHTDSTLGSTASGSKGSQMTAMTDTTESSTGRSDMIPTPNTLSPSSSLLSPYGTGSSIADTKRANRFSFPYAMLHNKKSSELQRPRSHLDVPSTLPASQDQVPRRRPNSVATPGLLPLSLPPHTLSFSPESIASYFSVSDQSSRLNTTFSSGSPVSHSSFTPAASLLSSNAPSDTYGLLASPIGTTTTSLQRSSESEYGGLAHGIHEAVTPSPSSLVLDNDSPILPSRGDDSPGSSMLAPSPYTRHLRTSQTLTPSAADMDAFGLAASRASRSASSIPTSFRSACAAESVSRLDSPSVVDTAQGHARRRSSVSLSLSMSLSRGSTDADVDERGVSALYNSVERASRMGSDSFQYPTMSYPPATETSRPAAVEAGKFTARQGGDAGAGKFWSLDKVKKLGGRIKKMFRGKHGEGSEGGHVAAAVTRAQEPEIEHTSEHPIPPPKDKGKGKLVAWPQNEAKPERTRSQRHRSMPIGPSVPTVSGPKPLRPNSFLVMDGPNPRLSRNVSVASSSRLRQENSDKIVRKSSMRAAPATSAPVSAPPGPSPAPERPMRARSRTQTAPPKEPPPRTRKERRFTLTSPLSKSRLDVLKNTILPHPPLPADIINSIRGDPRRYQRSRETSSGAVDRDVPQAVTTSHNVGETAESAQAGPSNSSWIEEPDIPARPCTDEDADAMGGQGSSSEGDHDRPGAVVSEQQATPIRAVPAAERSPNGHQHDPVVQSSPKTPTPRAKTRRSRGFSLSSAISAKAWKAKTIFLSRAGGPESQPRSPGNPSYSPGVPGHLSPTPTRPSDATSPVGSNVGCSDYEPDLILDNISFAQTSGMASSAVSTAHSESLVRECDVPAGGVHAILAGGFKSQDDSGVGVSADDGDDDADEIEGAEEREERGFMRALGLEFTQNARRSAESWEQ